MEMKEKIMNLLGDKLGYNPADIEETQDFIMDLGADSLDMVEIIMGIEQEFGLTFNDNEAIEIKTVGDLIKKVEEMMAK